MMRRPSLSKAKFNPTKRLSIMAGALVVVFSLTSFAFGQGAKLTQLPIPIPQAITRSQLVGHKAANDVIHINVSLQSQNPAALQAFADSVNDPKSPNYGKYATPAQLGQMFGQSATTVQKVVDYLKSKGFKITLVADNRMNIMADATVSQAESAFNTTINNYHLLNGSKYEREDYYSFAEPLQVPPAFASAILSISGADNVSKPVPLLHKKLKKVGTSALTPTQTRVLYNTAPMYTAGFQGKTKHVAISNWDGYRLSNVPLYYSQFNLPTPSGGVGTNIKVVTVDGGGGSGTPAGEGDLDIQMVLGMAPLANFTIYDGGGGLINVLTKEQNDNTSEIISESYGWNLGSTDAASAHNLHVLMSAQGITYMNASGDSGTSIEPYSYPDYDSETLKVGGTIANVDSTGNRTSEVGWSGSGGGWSLAGVNFNVLPSWQKGNGIPKTINYRLSPDVAINAAGDQTGAYQFYYNGSLNQDYDGTSFACPVFAGCLAVTSEKIVSLGGKSRLGRVQDAYYLQNGRSDVWFYVTQGNNGVLPNGNSSNATAYWDFVTGWGAPNFTKLASTVSVTPPKVFNVSSIGVYTNTAINPNVLEGSKPQGSAGSLASINGAGYSAGSVIEKPVGAVVSLQATVSTTIDPTKLSTLSLAFGGTTPNTSTVMIYLWNNKTSKYDLLQSASGSSFATSNTVMVKSATPADYIDGSGSIGILIHSLVPNSRLGTTPSYRLLVDQLQVLAVLNLN